MSVITPNWEDNVSLIEAKVTPGNSSGTTTLLDLRGKLGAWVYVALGRITNASVDASLVVSIRGMINNEAINHSRSGLTRTMNTVTADGNTTIDQSVSAGAREVFVAATTNFAVGDRIYIGATDGARAEFANVVGINSGVSLFVDEDIQLEHTAVQADVVLNQADVFDRIWVPGGANMSVQADYQSASSAPDVYVRVLAQTYDSNTST